MNYNAAMATGLFSGAQTISAVIGVGTDTISSLPDVDSATKKAWIDLIPVCYAVTYVFGTIGSAYLLGNLGPAMLGGLKKCVSRQRNTNSSSTIPHSPLIPLTSWATDRLSSAPTRSLPIILRLNDR